MAGAGIGGGGGGSLASLGLATTTTDNAICRFDGTGGGTQNSVVTVADTTGVIDIANASGALKVNGTQVVTVQGASVGDAAGGATIDTQARQAINDLLARLRTHGLIAP